MKITLRDRISATAHCIRGMLNPAPSRPFDRQLVADYFRGLDPKVLERTPLSVEEKVFIAETQKLALAIPSLKEPYQQVVNIGSGLLPIDDVLPFHPTSTVWNVDINAHFLRALKLKEWRTKAEFICADVEEQVYPDQKYHQFMALNVIHYLEDPARLLDKIQFSLRAGGYGLVSVCYQHPVWQSTLRGAGIRFYSSLTLVSMFKKAGFILHARQSVKLPLFPAGDTIIGEIFCLRKRNE